MVTKKWGFLLEPTRIKKDQLFVIKDNRATIPVYTLESLDFVLPDYEVRQKIKERWIKAKEENPRLIPGLKFMLIDFMSHLSLDFDVSYINLGFGVTDYGVFVATNSAAKKDPEFAQYLKENALIFYKNPFSYFANPLGNCAIVESSDGKIALIKRSDTVHEYPGFYDTPGGHPEPKKHDFNAEGQFDAIKDEVSEEIKIPKESIEEAYLIGIVLNLENFGKPDLLFHLKTGLHSDKMDQNHEVSRLEKLTRDELFEHFRKGTYNIVPPSEALLTAYYSLLGYELPLTSYTVKESIKKY